MQNSEEPSELNNYHAGYVQVMLESLRELTGHTPFDLSLPSARLAKQLYEYELPILAHEHAQDPKFTYVNLKAQELFEMRWEEMVQLPSRLSAENINQEGRRKVMEAVLAKGYLEDYGGIRITKSGRRFKIAKVTLWNLLDFEGHFYGQASIIGEWYDL